ncbi:MAG: cardiolipin synthase [Spirochaetaceae bacterium]|jgi:cardiolipin synthase|nr:cardiolipin synthase [Spirochaetaceae bacterium]
MLQTAIFQIITIISIIITIITAIIILLDESKSSESTISWLLFIFIFQWIGVIFYILLGINWKKGRIVQQRPEDIFGKYLSPALERQEQYFKSSLLKNQSAKYNDTVKTMRLLMFGNNSILTLNNRVKLYFDGQETFDDLFNDLEKAKESIHMEFYIWRSDILGEKIKKILIEKAKAGVKVKLIFDGLGSFKKISFKYRRELTDGGVQFKYFLDLNSALSRLKINYRNHRKIVIIDGRKGYTGGMNIGQEYIDGGKRFDTWRDTALRITGDSVMLLQALFLTDWSSSGNEQILDEKLFPAFHPADIKVPMQIAVSGPDSKWSSIEQLYFILITNANEEVWIQSPYFIPNSSILDAMQTSALSGVQINLMMTGVPDKKAPFWAAQTYFETLVESGVKIYQYKKGFLHSKFIVADSDISTVGTCNMDVRSFHINFEVNTVFYDRQIASQLVDQFKKDMIFCEEITLNKVKKKGIFIRVRNNLLRIFSPIM